MAILWKPTGSLDINTAPTDLPEQSDGGGIVSGAMTRCKNIRIDRQGIAELRFGSSLLASFTTVAPPELILEAGGHRYLFAGDEVFYDETEIFPGVICSTPEFSVEGGSYSTEQTVTITSDTERALIYYTMTVNGETPTAGSTKYTGPITVTAFRWLEAIAIDPLGYLYDSEVKSGYYLTWAQNALVTDTDDDTLITETDSDTLTTEGP